MNELPAQDVIEVLNTGTMLGDISEKAMGFHMMKRSE
jgi:hypothetical protein